MFACKQFSPDRPEIFVVMQRVTHGDPNSMGNVSDSTECVGKRFSIATNIFYLSLAAPSDVRTRTTFLI